MLWAKHLFRITLPTKKKHSMDTGAVENHYPRSTRNLGAIDEPVLVCGGAYSNYEALTAVLAAAAEHGISPERIIHTGDVVAYCASPVETANLLRDSGVHAIPGNVEESLWEAAPDCGCGFDEGSLCEKLSVEWFSYADALINNELRHWMGALPCQLTFTMNGRRVRVVHGGVREINAFFYASTLPAVSAGEFAAADADIIVAGHSGLPFTYREGPRIWHNSGALGLPANDGTPRVWYSLMVPECDGIAFTHCPLEYDHQVAQAKMIASGLPGGYADALVSGLWPSLDVLPEEELARTGKPLNPAHLNTAHKLAPAAE